MKSAYASSSRRGRLELMLAVGFSAAIIVAAIIPAPGSARLQASQSFFTLVEGDYNNPLFSSAGAIRVLNGAAKHVAQFAGYDEIRARVDFNESTTIANVTRFSGDLLKMLNVHVDLDERRVGDNSLVYISDTFWERAFSRSSEIIGAVLRVNQVNYRIAGIARSPSNFLQNTDLWIPIHSRSAMGNMNALKVIASLLSPRSWEVAQKEISAAFHEHLVDSIYSDAVGARIIPLVNRISFGEVVPILASRTSTRLSSGS